MYDDDNPGRLITRRVTEKFGLSTEVATAVVADVVDGIDIDQDLATLWTDVAAEHAPKLGPEHDDLEFGDVIEFIARHFGLTMGDMRY